MLISEALKNLEKIKTHLPKGDINWWYHKGYLDGFIDTRSKLVPSQDITNTNIPKLTEVFITKFVEAYQIKDIIL